jgi:hypothetical protein
MKAVYQLLYTKMTVKLHINIYNVFFEAPHIVSP